MEQYWGIVITKDGWFETDYISRDKKWVKNQFEPLEDNFLKKGKVYQLEIKEFPYFLAALNHYSNPPKTVTSEYFIFN